MNFKKRCRSNNTFWFLCKKEQDKRSDIDICIVCKKRKIKKVLEKILESGITEKYEVKIFELLSLKMKISAINEGKFLYSKDLVELSYYLESLGNCGKMKQ